MIDLDQFLLCNSVLIPKLGVSFNLIQWGTD